MLIFSKYARNFFFTLLNCNHLKNLHEMLNIFIIMLRHKTFLVSFAFDDICLQSSNTLMKFVTNIYKFLYLTLKSGLADINLLHNLIKI